jgi:hypothetical protein
MRLDEAIRNSMETGCKIRRTCAKWDKKSLRVVTLSTEWGIRFGFAGEKITRWTRRCDHPVEGFSVEDLIANDWECVL